MKATKEEVGALLQGLPGDCTLEDIQYHLFVLEKIRRGTERAENEGALSQLLVEQRLAKWLPK
jgi:hypothetical protein